MRPAPILAALLVLAAPGAGAAVLYKWVSSDGVVNFSDSAPPEGTQAIAYNAPGGSDEPPALPVSRLDELSQSDEAIARANTRVDLAEHALAVSRRPLWSPTDGLRLPRDDPPPADAAVKSRFYMSDVLQARKELLDTLRRRGRETR